MTMMEANNKILRLASRTESQEKRNLLEVEGSRTEGEEGLGSTGLKPMHLVPSRLTLTLSPYQTFQRQHGWLKALRGWPWNNMSCIAIITSMSHKPSRASHKQVSALCLRICTPDKMLLNFIPTRKWPISKTHTYFLDRRRTKAIPHNLIMLYIMSLYLLVPCGVWTKDTLTKPQEHPWEIQVCLGKLLLSYSCPLGKQPTLSNKHMGSQLNRKDRAQILVLVTLQRRWSWISSPLWHWPKESWL